MAQENAVGRVWEAADLIGGEDEDFIVNLYLAVLGRLPDPAGYRHYRESIAGRPERRIEALREAAGSAEARRAGTQVRFAPGPSVPPSPARAVQVSLAVFRDWVLRKLAGHDEAIGLLGGAGFGADLIESRDAALHYEMAALRREVTERLDAALGGPVAPEAAVRRDAVAASLARLVAERVEERVAAARAEMDHRLQALETRLLALEAGREA
ncbi:DUF4214 domain-containing protein [Paracraurococcus lichenis]|uniref:DUF4214 domain-containing protein n=1 Tax=Paracraurococcus lichenis TaxID=3064888 RepID=A0ABT9DU00_9PROT|nr:DUF4214 domain-containing protein [Paracraurococcus sp. LOR1-02]MDO9707380.1 DUF4214 domain-containing protein [Paracraurococcus sp. LOR1-02]